MISLACVPDSWGWQVERSKEFKWSPTLAIGLGHESEMVPRYVFLCLKRNKEDDTYNGEWSSSKDLKKKLIPDEKRNQVKSNEGTLHACSFASCNCTRTAAYCFLKGSDSLREQSSTTSSFIRFNSKTTASCTYRHSHEMTSLGFGNLFFHLTMKHDFTSTC